MHQKIQIRKFRGTLPSLKLTAKGRTPETLGHEPKGSIHSSEPTNHRFFSGGADSFREVYITDSSVLFLFPKHDLLRQFGWIRLSRSSTVRASGVVILGYNLVEGYPAEMGTNQGNSCDILMKFLEPQTGCSKYRFFIILLSIVYHLGLSFLHWVLRIFGETEG